MFQTEEERLTEQVCNAVDKIIGTKPSKTKLKLKVNRITLTASWKWRDSKDDDACGICRGAFEACCTNCKIPGDDCPIALGDCKHAFHLHCINKWVDSQQNPSCPLCRTEWKSVAAPANRSPISDNNNFASPNIVNNGLVSPAISGPAQSPTYSPGSPGRSREDSVQSPSDRYNIRNSPSYNYTPSTPAISGPAHSPSYRYSSDTPTYSALSPNNNAHSPLISHTPDPMEQDNESNHSPSYRYSSNSPITPQYPSYSPHSPDYMD